MLTTLLIKAVKPRGKIAFLASLPSSAKIFDVGCGNNSAYRIKKRFPNLRYTGIDIEADDQKKSQIPACEFIVSSPSNFAADIEKLDSAFDAVISNHNIEHCNDRQKTILAMIKALKPGVGKIFLAFPSEISETFPHRNGTLNYYDDPTHMGSPPNFQDTLNLLRAHGCSILFRSGRYRPFIMRIIGAILEPVSRWQKKVYSFTWAYYGFEAVIIAKRDHPSSEKSYLRSVQSSGDIRDSM
jgi:SAM-dependent methyltransferase